MNTYYTTLCMLNVPIASKMHIPLMSKWSQVHRKACFYIQCMKRKSEKNWKQKCPSACLICIKKHNCLLIFCLDFFFCIHVTDWHCHFNFFLMFFIQRLKVPIATTQHIQHAFIHQKQTWHSARWTCQFIAISVFNPGPNSANFDRRPVTYWMYGEKI